MWDLKHWCFYFFPIFLSIRFQEAEDDCTEALNLDDRYIKAYSRRATARKELRNFKEATEGILQYEIYHIILDWLKICFLLIILVMLISLMKKYS